MIESKNKELLGQILAKQDLSTDGAYHFLNEVMKGNVSEVTLAAFLTALKMKGETESELTGFVQAMRENAEKPNVNFDFDFIDTCGTGGDGKGSFNVSTLSAFTLASLGVKVAKHGNRSVSSLSGSSDILQTIGYDMDRPKEILTTEFTEKGFVFLFAQSWHPSMKYAGPVRRELGFRTFFNLIGPLSNPFHPTHQVVGVYEKSLLPVVTSVLSKLGTKKAIACHSRDGLDEFSIFAPTDYAYFDGKETHHLVFDPKTITGLFPLKEDEVFSKSKEDSLRHFKEVLGGQGTSGTDLVALNAGAALFVMGKAETISAGFELAKSALISKKVLEFVRETLNLSQVVSSLDK
ncbi:anthranilate phosphoribosyltransferase [Leptospira ognonensis]|uniref:Anthranilate phosphoribosyltransferase n=1 Tax=Leptospira ognonensis TaxID=2484945 RepID=A0A4R9KDF4_9LEPT|nr:anthranilate phosphoribosyltransferase [Leptospira ognonensis]TGL63859.1 anthranilate phosphoribosyltransferase [Leptospira ognonensis]